MRSTVERAAERIERSKLREFFDGVIQPRLEWEGASKSHVERHAAAVEHLERFVKRPLSPDEIDRELLAQFDSYLWRQGTSDSRRRDLIESLERICRTYSASTATFTKRCQRRLLPDPPVGSLRHYYEEFYVKLKLMGRTAKYIDENRAIMRSFYEHYGRDAAMAECTDALLADHVGWLLEKGYRPATINKYLGVISAVISHARKGGHVELRPAISRLPVETNAPDSWTPAQVEAFIDACPAARALVSKARLGDIDAADWWEAIVRVVWYTGMRRRALLAIRRTPPDVDLQSGWLRTPGSSQKNRKGQPFRLGLDALQAVARIWNPSREFLFTYNYQQKHEFYDMFHCIREAAGLPKSASHAGAMHLLRRSSATELYLQRGVGAAQALLGHSSPQLTMRHYVDPSRVPAQDFTDALKPLAPRKSSANQPSSGVTG